jgi:hypothetical protein
MESIMQTYLPAVLLAAGALGSPARAQELVPHPSAGPSKPAPAAQPARRDPAGAAVPQALGATLTAERFTLPSAPICSESLSDQGAPGSCVGASSVPALGTLYPLGTEFNIAPSGNVGIGTLAPEHALDVAGDIGGSGGLELGDLASLDYENDFVDMSYTVSDVSGTVFSSPFYSLVLTDPDQDLSAGGLHGHSLHTASEATNPFDIGSLHGSWMQVSHYGTGTVASLNGAEAFANTHNTGHTNFQVALTVEAMAGESATVDQNRAVDVYSGHAGTEGGGWITDNYGVFVGTPYHLSPIENNYGIYVADQAVASGTNYAIYAAGGANYFAGNVGIGAAPSGYALQVGEPGDGSEARANAWNLLSSREYKCDIEALDEQALDEILEEIEATDVVRYRYVDDDHRRLGVIAEESPEEILSRDKRGVSLGEYSAFLLAGIKAQQRELRAQEEQLALLRGRIDDLDSLREELASLRASAAAGAR